LVFSLTPQFAHDARSQKPKVQHLHSNYRLRACWRPSCKAHHTKDQYEHRKGSSQGCTAFSFWASRQIVFIFWPADRIDVNLSLCLAKCHHEDVRVRNEEGLCVNNSWTIQEFHVPAALHPQQEYRYWFNEGLEWPQNQAGYIGIEKSIAGCTQIFHLFGFNRYIHLHHCEHLKPRPALNFHLILNRCPEIESRGREIFCTRPERPWGPPRLLYNGYRVSSPGVKRPVSGVDHHPPSSSAEVKERVEVYLYFPYGPSWPVLGWTSQNCFDVWYWNHGGQ